MKRVIVLFILFFNLFVKSALCDNFEDVIGLKIIDTIKYQLTEKPNTKYSFFSGSGVLETNLAKYILSNDGLIEISGKNNRGNEFLFIKLTDTIFNKIDSIKLTVFFINHSANQQGYVLFKNSTYGIIDSFCDYQSFLFKKPAGTSQLEIVENCLRIKSTERDTIHFIAFDTASNQYSNQKYFLFPDLFQSDVIKTDTINLNIIGLISDTTVEIPYPLLFKEKPNFGLQYINQIYNYYQVTTDGKLKIKVFSPFPESIEIQAWFSNFNIIDTTVVFIKVLPPTDSDTIYDTICKSNCSKVYCLDTTWTDNSTTVTLCKISSSLIADVFLLPNSCLEISAKGSLGRDTICVTVCDDVTGDCDTTIIIMFLPSTSDTIYAPILVGKRDSVCIPIEEGMQADNVTAFFCAGIADNVSNIQTQMGEDCIWLSYTGISEGLDQICIETCDNELNLCDTTVIILSEKSKEIIQVCDTCTVSFCLDTMFYITNSTWAFCDGSAELTTLLGTASIDVLTGCVTYFSNGTIGFDTLCVIHCDTISGVCNTKNPIMKIFQNYIRATTDTIIINIPKNLTDTICFELESGFGGGDIYYSLCDGAENGTSTYGDWTLFQNGCLVYNSKSTVGLNIDTICVMVCDASLGLCDTSIFFITNISDTLNLKEERLYVDIYTDRIRYCGVSNNNFVTYINNSPITISDVYIDVFLDEQLELISADKTYILLDPHHLRFLIGDLSPQQKGYFWFRTNLPCGTSTPGETHCVTAHIFPDTIANRLNDRPLIAVEAECLGDSVQFQISNSGKAMPTPAIYLVFEDDLMIKRNSYRLGNGESFTEKYIANGHTYRLEAHVNAKYQQFYGDSISAAWIEGCGIDGGTISKGFVLMYDLDEDQDYIAKDCRESVTSWDPNEKLATPIGYHEQHFIRKDQEIEYGINFENLGNDTAYIVVIVDTLSSYLDTSTFKFLSSSHPCTFVLSNYILTLTFPKINLLWTAINPDSSKGFFHYSIKPESDVAVDSKIENTAYIYFDNNPAVQTNTVFHTIGEQFVRILSIKNESKIVIINAYPNPASDRIMFDLNGLVSTNNSIKIYDINGRLIDFRANISNGIIEISTKEFRIGNYYFTIEEDNNNVASGKFIIAY
ncbi:MAG: T9SS type A sorting domain-containing protein [Bacteroidetes bacterium]|nr:T9SS type A sorting domain-containing protein [Bacteroidota bacterium]